MDVDENGTEAAAATVIEIMVGASMDPPPVIKFNRPFLMWIVERDTRSILFMGKIVNPKAP